MACQYTVTVRGVGQSKPCHATAVVAHAIARQRNGIAQRCQNNAWSSRPHVACHRPISAHAKPHARTATNHALPGQRESHARANRRCNTFSFTQNAARCPDCPELLPTNGTRLKQLVQASCNVLLPHMPPHIPTTVTTLLHSCSPAAARPGRARGAPAPGRSVQWPQRSPRLRQRQYIAMRLVHEAGELAWHGHGMQAAARHSHDKRAAWEARAPAGDRLPGRPWSGLTTMQLHSIDTGMPRLEPGLICNSCLRSHAQSFAQLPQPPNPPSHLASQQQQHRSPKLLRKKASSAM